MDPRLDWIDDRTLGRALVERGIAPLAQVDATLASLAPGQRLAESLVERRLVSPDALLGLAQQLARERETLGDGGASAATGPGPTRADAGDEARAQASGVAGPGRGPAAGVTVAGRFRLEARLGRGGMGEVWRATELAAGRPVALKVLLDASSPTTRARFQREAELGARVDAGGGVVRVLASGDDGGRPWLAMELVDGPSLGSEVARGPLPVERAARLVEAIARTVEALHRAGVLHRDLKPDNVLVRREDDAPRLADFGLAVDPGAERLTRTGDLLGTPAYMAPEQASDSARAIDARVDVYGAGAILYAALAGRPPFVGPAPTVIKGVLLDDPPWPIALRPEVPADLDAVVRKAMAKEPGERYARALDLADDLARFRRGEPVLARPIGRVARLRRRWRRGDPRLVWPARGLAGAALLALVAAGLGVAQRARDEVKHGLAFEDELVARHAFADPEGEAAAARDGALDLAARRARLTRWPAALRGARAADVDAALARLDGLERLAAHRRGEPVLVPRRAGPERAPLDLLVDAVVLAGRGDGREAMARLVLARDASAPPPLVDRVGAAVVEARLAADPGAVREVFADLAKLGATAQAAPGARRVAERALRLAARAAVDDAVADRPEEARGARRRLEGLIEVGARFLDADDAAAIVIEAKREALEASGAAWLARWETSPKDEASAQRLVRDLTALARGAPPIDEVRAPAFTTLHEALLAPTLEAYLKASHDARPLAARAVLQRDLSRSGVLGWAHDDRLDKIVQAWHLDRERDELPALVRVATLRCTLPFGQTARGLAETESEEVGRELAQLDHDYPGSAAIALLRILRPVANRAYDLMPAEQRLPHVARACDELRALLARPRTDLSRTFEAEAWLRLAQLLLSRRYYVGDRPEGVPWLREARDAARRAREGVTADLVLESWDEEASAASLLDRASALPVRRAAVEDFRARLRRAQTEGPDTADLGGAFVGAGSVAAGERDGLARALNRLGALHQGDGRFDEARRAYAEAIVVCAGGITGQGVLPHARGGLALALVSLRDLDAAEAALAPGLPADLEDDLFTEAAVRLALARGDRARARDLLRRGLVGAEPGSTRHNRLDPLRADVGD